MDSNIQDTSHFKTFHENYSEVSIKVEIQTEENNCVAVDINDIDVKPDLLTLRTNIQNSKCEIKPEITHVDIKKEVEDHYNEILSAKQEFSEMLIQVKQENVEVTESKKDPLSIKNKCDLCNKNFTRNRDLKRHTGGYR